LNLSSLKKLALQHWDKAFLAVAVFVAVICLYGWMYDWLGSGSAEVNQARHRLEQAEDLVRTGGRKTPEEVPPFPRAIARAFEQRRPWEPVTPKLFRSLEEPQRGGDIRVDVGLTKRIPNTYGAPIDRAWVTDARLADAEVFTSRMGFEVRGKTKGTTEVRVVLVQDPRLIIHRLFVDPEKKEYTVEERSPAPPLDVTYESSRGSRVILRWKRDIRVDRQVKDDPRARVRRLVKLAGFQVRRGENRDPKQMELIALVRPATRKKPETAPFGADPGATPPMTPGAGELGVPADLQEDFEFTDQGEHLKPDSTVYYALRAVGTDEKKFASDFLTIEVTLPSDLEIELRGGSVRPVLATLRVIKYVLIGGKERKLERTYFLSLGQRLGDSQWVRLEEPDGRPKREKVDFSTGYVLIDFQEAPFLRKKMRAVFNPVDGTTKRVEVSLSERRKRVILDHPEKGRQICWEAGRKARPAPRAAPKKSGGPAKTRAKKVSRQRADLSGDPSGRRTAAKKSRGKTGTSTLRLGGRTWMMLEKSKSSR